jgi:hypothetical protein
MNILNLICVALSAYVAGILYHRSLYNTMCAILYMANLIGVIMNMIVLYPLVRV